jgi:hypothetical protein
MAAYTPPTPHTIHGPVKEKLAVISGSFIESGGQNKTGVWLNGEIQTRFAEFAKTHDIIDWNVTQENNSMSWSMFIRYKP